MLGHYTTGPCVLMAIASEQTVELAQHNDAASCTRPCVAGVPGLEPRLTEPESVGLPITPYPKAADCSAFVWLRSIRPDAPRRRSPAPLAARRAAEVAAQASRRGPRISSDSNSGGEMRRPVTATRTGPKATLGLSPRPSTSAVRSACSMTCSDRHSGAAESAVDGGVQDRLRRQPRSSAAASVSSTAKRSSGRSRNASIPTDCRRFSMRSCTRGTAASSTARWPSDGGVADHAAPRRGRA